MPVTLEIRGTLVGPIWMPACECYKPLSYDIGREQARTVGGKMTLRDHVLRATNDGDFQHCEIADGVIVATFKRATKNGYNTRTRYFDLARFPSIADCLRLDWGGPIGDAD